MAVRMRIMQAGCHGSSCAAADRAGACGRGRANSYLPVVQELIFLWIPGARLRKRSGLVLIPAGYHSEGTAEAA